MTRLGFVLPHGLEPRTDAAQPPTRGTYFRTRKDQVKGPMPMKLGRSPAAIGDSYDDYEESLGDKCGTACSSTASYGADCCTGCFYVASDWVTACFGCASTGCACALGACRACGDCCSGVCGGRGDTE